MSRDYLNHSDFDISSAQKTGGVTGSKKVKKDGINYQLKPSIKDAKLSRRAKAGFVDKENFGEVIAATVGRVITGSGDVGNPELVPEVSLVYKADKKTGRDRVMVASKYLPNVEKGTIDDYAKHPDGCGVKTTKRHVKVSGTATKLTPKKDTWGIGGNGTEDKQLRRDLAQAIAVSILSGDHDVNPGNMIVLKDSEGKKRIARIDFGHAFNDLISYKSFGGAQFSENKVLDFVNRETINKFPKGDTSKLWRDYSGIIPSSEIAEVFKEMANSPKMQDGVNAAKKQFQDLVDDLKADPKKNAATLEHIKESLIAISDNVTDKKIDSKKVTIDLALDQTFKNLADFYQKGQEQMKDVAKLMDMQVKIDKVIMDKKSGKQIDQDVMKEIQNTYKELEENKGNLIGKGPGKGIDWVKNDKKKEAFKGNLREFIKHRSDELGLKAESKKSLQEDFSFSEKTGFIKKFLHKVQEVLDKVQDALLDKVQEIFDYKKQGIKVISNPELINTTANLEEMKLQPIKQQSPKTPNKKHKKTIEIVDAIKKKSHVTAKSDKWVNVVVNSKPKTNERMP